MQKKLDVKKLAMLGMLCALAYVLMVVGRFPIISVPGLVLKYDPKDVIIALGGFLFGPLSAAAISLVVSFVEMFTVSETGWIGFAMNMLSTCAFVCTAAVIYKKKPTITRAAAGLAAGALLTTAVMLLWNYFLTPIFVGAPREAVAGMLIPVFLPFNLIKSGLNAAIAMLIYKPVTAALRKQRLLPPSENTETAKGKFKIGVMLLSCLVVITCVVFILVLRGII